MVLFLDRMDGMERNGQNEWKGDADCKMVDCFMIGVRREIISFLFL